VQPEAAGPYNEGGQDEKAVSRNKFEGCIIGIADNTGRKGQYYSQQRNENQFQKEVLDHGFQVWFGFLRLCPRNGQSRAIKNLKRKSAIKLFACLVKQVQIFFHGRISLQVVKGITTRLRR